MAGQKKNRAVFLDRDGVVIEEVNYLSHPDQLRLIPGSARAIARLRRAGFKVVVVTNQSGVARGYLTLKTLREVHRLLVKRLARGGAKLDGIYSCPHLPAKAGKKGCACRKPELGMLKRARKRFGLDLPRSYFVGDTTTDTLTARRAGCAAILVRTGKAGRDRVYRAKPHRTCKDLASAADWIIGIRGHKT
ncbi:MAG: HAD family hydrolase [Elusimicrobia bacterium]|nr:HAD family hydrolase [Elusimicrobiota bacterium]